MALKSKRVLDGAIQRSGVNTPLFSLDQFCFAKQLAFVRSPERFKTSVTSRRAGKTKGIAADLVATCLEERDVTNLYITLTRRSAKNIIWEDIKRILDDYKIPNKIDNTALEVSFPQTRSRLMLGGAKDETEIEKYRGLPRLKKVYIDECQSFRPYLKYFIDDIIIPGLRDLRGQLGLTGTPGPVPAGPFFDYSHAEGWAHFYWTAFDNPYMHNPPLLDLNETLAEERLIKGIDESDPGYIRETLGRWIEDFNSLVFRFSQRNVCPKMPDDKYEYVFGIDIGYHDSDAIAVLAYSLKDKNVYLVEEVIRERQGITPLIAQIETLRARYNPVKMVMDTGGLGKKIQEELRTRHQIPIVAAEKTRKFEFIELLNDDLRTGRFHSYPNSRFQQDCNLVQWDKTRSDKLAVSDSYHSDITDAVLYGWRECRHYLAQIEPERPKYGTAEYWKAEDARLEEEEMEAAVKSQDKAFWDDGDDDIGGKGFWER